MTTVLQQVSNDLAATVEAVSPGLVRVEARRRFPASGMVWSPDGVIVTAHHVIEQDDAVRVGLHGGQTVTAILIGRAGKQRLGKLAREFVWRVQAPLGVAKDPHRDRGRKPFMP